MKVAVCVGIHSVPASVVNVLDVLHAANRHAGASLFETRLLSDTPPPPAWHGVRLEPQGSLRAAAACDLVLLPAFRAELAQALHDQGVLLQRLPRWGRQGRRLASACAGSLLLAASGVLDGRRATTHWSLLNLARRAFPAVHWQLNHVVERDGLLLTSGGGSGAIDLALALVEEQGGLPLAKRVAASLLFDPHRGAQSQYFPLAPRELVSDPLVTEAQRLLTARLEAPPSVAELADALHVTPRTLLRHFRAATGLTVKAYAQRLRLDAARQMLDQGPHAVEQAMHAVGYGDRASFSRRFKQHFGMSPGAFKQRRAGMP
jgi:transcriptional regulator GlxA family with amidase domain